jgi:hypothetical protein
MPALRCPVCKAENSAGPACRRCKAELSLLFELEEYRDRLLAEARERAAEGRWREFLAAVERAHGLRRDERTRELRAVGRLMVGDFEAVGELQRGVS